MGLVENPDALLAGARSGDREALGRLLESYRFYLKLIARSQLKGALQSKLDPSDLVQDAYLDAFRDFPKFQGRSEGEFLSWLRRILVHAAVDQCRRLRLADGEKGKLESLEALFERSSVAAHKALTDSITSPSAGAARREQAVIFANALSALPEEYSEVLVLRHLERLSFEDIGRRLGRSAGAARMLWLRAVEKLKVGIADRD